MGRDVEAQHIMPIVDRMDHAYYSVGADSAHPTLPSLTIGKYKKQKIRKKKYVDK